MAAKKEEEQQQMAAGMGQGQPEQPTQEQMQQYQEHMANAQALMQVAQQQQNIADQQQNSQHDTEFSQFSQGAGAVETLNVIGEDQIKQAYETLMKYKEEKAMLEQRIEENEKFYKMRQWEMMSKTEDNRIKPRSAWLVNTIINKHADAMDNYPEANVLPRAKDDEATAKILSDVVPVILEQNDFLNTYSGVQWYKMKNGTGVYGVFWNNDKMNGLGDVDIKKVDLSNVFWKGGITDIQESPNFFYVTMMDNDEIEARYPNIHAGSTGDLPLTPLDHYNDDENIDRTGQSPVIDWYYRKRVQFTDENNIPRTKTYLHYCQFTCGQVIYASENDPQYADKGWYDHGKYPFVFDVLYPVEGAATGMGFIDICKDDQMYIDKLQQAILENAITNARPRYAVRTDSGINEAEFLDLSKPTVHFDGNLGEDAFRQITPSPMSSIYETVYQYKIQEMKDTSGNTASSQGQVSSVTTASGIASLQEAAGKLSRDSNMQAYRSFKQVIYMVIELIREFYNEPRCFRIAGEEGQNEFVNFDNQGLLPQQQGSAFGIDLGSRLPIMDIDVRPQKKSAYSKETQNQTALNLYNMGFFAPNNADASLACLNMMDFDNIEKIKEQVRTNGTMYNTIMQQAQIIQQMSAIIDGATGGNMEESAAANTEQQAEMNNGGKKSTEIQTSRGSIPSQAAATTRSSASPR